jgi:Fe-S cluster assembly scaffold protein SufB
MRKGAKGSKASEHSSVLMLSQKARADTIPSLLVGESEVEASHAATVGSVDEQRVFYLMSRGFSRERAIRFIVQELLSQYSKRSTRSFLPSTEVVRMNSQKKSEPRVKGLRRDFPIFRNHPSLCVSGQCSHNP